MTQASIATGLGLLGSLTDINITIESPLNESCLVLLGHLSAELAERYPDEIVGTPFSLAQLMGSWAAFLMASMDGEPIGCGAIRPLVPGVAEVKRMFVIAQARGQGVGRKLLQHLELVAEDMGYETMRLETGVRQPEAIALYEATGYQRVGCYGQYVTNPLSVCFEKRLEQR